MVKNLILRLSLVIILIMLSGCINDESKENDILVDTVELDLKGSDSLDISAISSMKNLRELNLQDTNASYSDIEFIKAQLPDCKIIFDVEIDECRYLSNVESLDLSNCKIDDIEDLIYKLSFFYNLSEVLLESSNIELSDYKTLTDVYPIIDFKMNIKIGEHSFSHRESVIKLGLTNEYDIEGMINSFSYFEQLDKVDFGHTIFMQEEMTKLIEAYPDVDFLWNVKLLDRAISSDATEIDVSETFIDDFNAFNNALSFLPNATHIEMCNCGLTNEQMENLQLNHPDKKFVWMIRIRNWEMRTDVRAFSSGNIDTFEGGKFLGGGTVLRDDDVAPLKYCTDLIALDLGHQGNIYDFSFLEFMPNLQYLVVAMTGITDLSTLADLDELMYLEVFNAAVSDLSPLLGLKNLKHLNCSMTFIRDTDELLQMTQLERLWIVNSWLSEKQIAELREVLDNTVIVSEAKSPTHGGWRSEDAQSYIDMQELFNMQPLFSGGVVE